jgi:hypothetical protein
LERTRVTIDRDDLAARADELSESEREGAGPGTEIGPRSTARDAFAQQANVVRVIH